MTYKSLKRLFLSACLLAPLSAGAQEFDSELQLSTDITYWYRICSAASGMEEYAVTDCSELVQDTDFPIQLLQVETDNQAAQWKLTAGTDGKVNIVNRATGKSINNVSVNNEPETNFFNATQLTTETAPGFTVTSLGDCAFRLESVEDDGVNRCLALTNLNGEALTYPETAESTSIVGWKFFPVEIDTGIGSAGAGRTIIQVKNKRISVTGCSEWQLFNAKGEKMPRTVALPTGVYLVKMLQRTVKVAIP